MTLYRAMCKEEFIKSIKSGVACFDIKRFKWFSPNLEWIKSRVQDGRFNNSQHKPDKYVYLVQFKLVYGEFDFVSTNEVQFDRRKNPTIVFVKLIEA